MESPEQLRSTSEPIAKPTIKSETKWLSEISQEPEDGCPEVVNSREALQSIKADVESFPIDAVAYAAELVTPVQLPPNDSFETKIESIDEEFLDTKNDYKSAPYVQKNKHSFETFDVQSSKVTEGHVDTIASEFSEQQMTLTHHGRVYQCEKCSRSFKSKWNYTRHGIIHDDNLRRKYMHMRPTRSDKTYQCGMCSRSFNHQWNLDRHMITHDKDRKLEFACNVCERRFYTSTGLNRHELLHTGGIHNCERCGARFTQKSSLNRHLLQCPAFATASKRQQYKCKDCDKAFAHKHLLYTHSTEHTGLPWMCGICKRKFTLRRRLSAHIRRAHRTIDKNTANKFMQRVPTAKEFSTNTVPLQSIKKADGIQQFSPIPQTIEHIKTELILDEEFLDEDVPQSASYIKENEQNTMESADKLHRTITGAYEGTDSNLPRNYTCEQCQCQFLERRSLEKHLITHDKNRKPEYACHLCERRFYTKTGLNFHVSAHSGVSHICEQCGARFTTKGSMTRHVLRCKNEPNQHKDQRHKCKYCEKEYGNRYLLYTHIKEHTGLPWRCGICKNKFSNKDGCRQHVARVHKIRRKEYIEYIQDVSTANEISKELKPPESITIKEESFRDEAEANASQQFSLNSDIPFDANVNQKAEVMLEEHFVDKKDFSESAFNAYGDDTQ